mmetsp:Transcript_11753/g.34858  ORF Transcript_11753/g.34858 Transcript_11753/m.34858 type:complete len:299 (-) Transcript_11753:559-1455(-)
MRSRGRAASGPLRSECPPRVPYTPDTAPLRTPARAPRAGGTAAPDAPGIAPGSPAAFSAAEEPKAPGVGDGPRAAADSPSQARTRSSAPLSARAAPHRRGNVSASSATAWSESKAGLRPPATTARRARPCHSCARAAALARAWRAWRRGPGTRCLEWPWCCVLAPPAAACPPPWSWPALSPPAGNSSHNAMPWRSSSSTWSRAGTCDSSRGASSAPEPAMPSASARSSDCISTKATAAHTACAAASHWRARSSRSSMSAARAEESARPWLASERARRSVSVAACREAACACQLSMAWR